MSEHFLVVGGRQRPDALSLPEWGRYQTGLILAVEPATGHAETLVEYVSPPEAIPTEDPCDILFKAATLTADRLYACTQTEVLVYETPGFRQVGYLSLPSFNDVHHVLPTERGTWLVADTGLDLVLEVTPAGAPVREWGVLGQDPWQRFDRRVDYRKAPTTKPHASHPNFVFEADGEIWATRFEQKDAICLTAPARSIAIAVERPHDGIVLGARVYFTTVDGHVVVTRWTDGQVERVIDLKAIVGGDLVLGWCRGLAVLDERRVVVGFSRLRPTALRENVRWVKRRLGLRTAAGGRPSHVACFDLEARRLLWEQDVEAAGMATVFSIHAWR